MLSGVSKLQSALLSLTCLAVAAGIFLKFDSLTGAGWRDYLRLTSEKQYHYKPVGGGDRYPEPSAESKAVDKWTLLWPTLVYLAVAAAFVGASCYFFYRAFEPLFVEESG